jgi:3-oxoacyl-(acyl-carrier-protein) synthase
MSTTTMNQKSEDIVVTGLGMLTATGLGVESNVQAFDQESSKKTAEDYKVVGFNPAPHLTDKKVVKAVSHRDVLGLVAMEDCLKQSGIKAETINPDRTGLYVGAPASSCADLHNYSDAVLASVDAYGVLNEKAFGEHFRSASPTTLLTGLPNNVLCYGAKTLDARGPNSNYTTMETSSHMAVMGATRALKMGRLDCAVVGGYTAHSNKEFISSMKQRGLYDGTPIAEGAAFATLETRANATKRGAKPVCRIVSCAAATDAMGPYKTNAQSPVLTDLVKQALQNAKVKATDIGIIMTSDSGLAPVDAAEQTAIDTIWNGAEKPAMASTSARWGNLVEAGGLAEIAFLSSCYTKKTVPNSAKVKNGGEFNSTKRTALILRSSPWGEYSCMIVEME